MLKGEQSCALEMHCHDSQGIGQTDVSLRAMRQTTTFLEKSGQCQGLHLQLCLERILRRRGRPDLALAQPDGAHVQLGRALSLRPALLRQLLLLGGQPVRPAPLTLRLRPQALGLPRQARLLAAQLRSLSCLALRLGRQAGRLLLQQEGRTLPKTSALSTDSKYYYA